MRRTILLATVKSATAVARNEAITNEGDMPTERQKTADKIDCDLARLARRAEDAGLIELCRKIRIARVEARDRMSRKQLEAAPH